MQKSAPTSHLERPPPPRQRAVAAHSPLGRGRRPPSVSVSRIARPEHAQPAARRRHRTRAVAARPYRVGRDEPRRRGAPQTPPPTSPPRLSRARTPRARALRPARRHPTACDDEERHAALAAGATRSQTPATPPAARAALSCPKPPHHHSSPPPQPASRGGLSARATGSKVVDGPGEHHFGDAAASSPARVSAVHDTAPVAARPEAWPQNSHVGRWCGSFANFTTDTWVRLPRAESMDGKNVTFFLSGFFMW